MTLTFATIKQAISRARNMSFKDLGDVLDALARGDDLYVGGAQVTATAAELNILDGVTASTAELNILDGVTATTAEINAAADVSGRHVAIGDADTAILAANSGKPHTIANVSADRTFTLPAAAAGLEFEFIAEVGAADGHDWIFVAAATADLFKGGLLMVDTDAAPATVAAVVADQVDDDQLQVNLPQGGTRIKMVCDGTYWIVSGTILSTAAAVFS